MDAERARQIIVAEPPRRLRMSELLEELGAFTPDEPDPTAAADPTVASEDLRSVPPPPRTLHLTVGELVDKGAEAGFGFLIGILVLIAIPFFGLSTPFGIAIAIVGAQMMVGRPRPWLPRRARRRELSMTMLDRVATLLARRTRWLVRATRRRWEVLLGPRVVGLGVVVLALGLALPLPIPGSNWVFLIPLFVYAIGLLERDGVWILIGHVLTIADLVLLIVFWQVVWTVLAGVWAWLT